MKLSQTHKIIAATAALLVLPKLLFGKSSSNGGGGTGASNCNGNGPADISYLGRNDLSRGIRNNNPLNLKYVAGNPWQGKLPLSENYDDSPEGRHEQFYCWKYGIRAGMVLLRNYINQGNNTIDKIVSKWAVANTGNYGNFVAGKMGLSKYTTLTPNRTTLTGLIRAMTDWENTQKGYVTQAQADQVWSEFNF